MKLNDLSAQILGAAIEVHKQLGPGLLENIYKKCLVYELCNLGLCVESEITIPVKYKELYFPGAYRVDILVEDRIVIELKAIEKILPVHGAQLLSYLKLSQHELGLLINFNVPQLKEGVKRIINPL